MKETLFVTDLDGTLLRPDAQLSPRSRDILCALIQRGLRFSYATARSQRSAAERLAGLPLREPVIAYNGGLMTSPDGKMVYHRAALTYAQIRDCMEPLWERGYRPVVHGHLDGRERVAWMAGEETPEIRQYLSDRPGDPRQCPVRDQEALFAGEIVNISIIGQEEPMRVAYEMIREHPLLMVHYQRDTYHPDEFWMEIQRDDATKAQGVQRLKEALGLSRLVCFGDHLNDLSMFQVADESYAVGNAVPELRAVASGVIGHNTVDGVAEYLWEQYGS